MSDNKIIFTSTIESREKLYIALINFFGEKLYKIRYYFIPIYELYHYKIFLELRINNYNQFLIFTSSFCANKTCENDDDEHYSGLFIFSYPNSKDYIFSVAEYLINNNNITIERIEIDLKEQLNLENNIFGYILMNTKIIEIESGSELEYKLYSSNNESLEITNNYTLEKDENIILKYTGDLKYIRNFIKTIKYYFIATEPDYNIYETYPQQSEGENDASYFKKEEYIGRLSYYTIKLENDLSNECNYNCDFCLKLTTTDCVTCKYNFSISENIKTCYDNEKLETTFIQTTVITNRETEINTVQITEQITELLTEKTTEMITQKITEETTKMITPTIIEETTEMITQKITEETTEMITPTIIEETTEMITPTIIEETTEIITPKITEETTEIITDITTEPKFNEITYNVQEISDIIPQEIKDEKKCSKEEILSNKCSQGSMTEEQISQLYNQLKDNLLTDYDGENTIIQTENVVFQISTLDDQKNMENPNVSSIDLGDCEKELKKHEGIPDNMSLIVFKTDIKTEDLTQTFVQYEIYDPRDLHALDLSICKDMSICVSTPVKLDSTTSSLYDTLKESGYDLFNENDDFYTDICSIYTSANGTDMTLDDRKKEIFSTSGNKTLCQSGYDLEYYNSTNKKAKCQCSPQLIETEPSLSSSKDKFNIKQIADSF